MNLVPIAQVIGLLAMASIFGATVWFFFVQSPVLLRRMGREAFVPLQMRLTVVLFRTLVPLLGVVLGAAVVHSSMGSTAFVTAGVALLGGLLNRFVVVPHALQAGGRSRTDIKGMDHEGSTARFASEGAGRRTRQLHRTVVVLVVVMLGGLVGHGMSLLAII